MTFSIPFFLLLIIVLSMDAFAAGFSYGTEQVQVPFFSLAILAFLSGGMLTASMLMGNILFDAIPAGLTKGISFGVLAALSLYKFYEAFPLLHKKETRLTTEEISRKINRKEKAVLSRQEAALLSIALSIDNISAGLSTGSLPLSCGLLLFLTISVHFAAMGLGLYAGRLFSSGNSQRFSWLGAAVLMLLALFQLL